MGQRILCGLLLVAVGCGDAEPPPDAGPADAGVDAGFPDAAVDAGPLMFTLQVDFRGDGLGQVASTPAGLVCNEDCVAQYAPGTEITLLATEGQATVFGGWDGAGCGAEPTCTFTMDADLDLEVRFSRIYQLTIEPVGDGLGVVDVDGERCQGSCDLEVISETQVVLEAIPAEGVEFVGWSGPCSGPDPVCRVGINADQFVRPLFEVETPQIVGGGEHFCGLIRSGVVRCWGRGDKGQLGRQSNDNLGDDESVSAQGALPLGLDVMHLAAGRDHTCVLQRSGAVRCWGDNSDGQLGLGNTTAVGNLGGAAPADVADVDLGGAALQVAAGGAHTCALMTSGAIRCWGRGAEGQLGYGNADNVADGAAPLASPAEAGDVPLGARARFIAAMGNQTCAILDGGDVKCWGSNATGQLGYGFAGNAGDGTPGRATPADLSPVELGAPVRSLKLGPNHTCARYVDRRVRCWGDNPRGQLGDGSRMQVAGEGGLPIDTAIDVLLGQEVAVEVAVGRAHGCVTLQDGGIRCWGSGDSGATGYEATDDELSPGDRLALITGHRPLSLAAAGDTTCVATRFGRGASDFAVLCWGDGAHGGLASGSTADVGDRPGTMPPAPSTVF